MSIIFEWDHEKAKKNFRKHGVTFDEASTAFNDPFSRTIVDPLHSNGEFRFVLIGRSYIGRLLIVVHTEMEDKIRIISSRVATRRERINYEENAE